MSAFQRRYGALSLGALLLLLPSPVVAQLDVKRFLDQVSSAVRARYLDGYVVSIDRHKRADPHFGLALGGTLRDQFPPAPIIHFRDDGIHDLVTLARLGHCVRYDLHNKAGETWLWLTDGQMLWTYCRNIGLYTEVPAEAWPKRLGPGPGLPGVEWKYVDKFLALSGMTNKARFVSDDLAPTSECPGPSTLLELTIPGGKEELRVLSKSHLPCQSTTHRTIRTPRAGLYDLDETIVWKFAPDPPAASLFVFTPNRGSKRVKRLPRVE
jgi:hypothetical protein